MNLLELGFLQSPPIPFSPYLLEGLALLGATTDAAVLFFSPAHYGYYASSAPAGFSSSASHFVFSFFILSLTSYSP